MSYTYDDLYMWDDKTWENSDAPIHPIVKNLLNYSYNNVLSNYKTGKYADRKDEIVDAKTNAYIFDDVVEYYKEKGLLFHLTAMGFVAWIALIPFNHTRDTETLVIFHCADMKDPMWAMDTLEYYKKYNEKCAKENFALLYLVYANNMPAGIYMDIMLELSALWKIDMKKVYLDVSTLDNKDIDANFKPFSYHDIKAIDITNKWIARTPHQYICKTLNKRNPEFNVERLVHSTLGKRIAESMHLEEKYSKWNDKGLKEFFDKKGLEINEHYTEFERWLTVTPKSMKENTPLLICMKEVRPSSEFQSLIALQFYYDYLDISANGECALLFFALESPDDNELLVKIIKEMHNIYHTDKSRTYIIGQSHNGCLALEFARRHHDIITAVAQLNDRHGFAAPSYSVDSVKITDYMIDDFASFDLPLINICGEIENIFPHCKLGSVEFNNQLEALHRRYKAFNIKDPTDQEIINALTSSDKATRKNGLPSDHTEIIYTMGFECYISDFKNKDGNYHLRLCTLENMPHMISPQMMELSWSFLRRFKRENNNIIEINNQGGMKL